MKKMSTFRAWLAALLARPQLPDPLAGLGLRERADLPPDHPC